MVTARSHFFYRWDIPVVFREYNYGVIQRLEYSLTQLSVRQKVKVKESHYRPWQALRFPGVWDSQILKQSAHEGGKVVSPTHRPPLPQETFLVLISVGGRVDPRAIVRQKDYVNKKFQWHHRESIPRPSGLQRSASTNCTIACPLSVTQFIEMYFQSYIPATCFGSYKWCHLAGWTSKVNMYNWYAC
jgi:hypothetical protein